MSVFQNEQYNYSVPVVGINTEKLKKLILEVYESAEKVKTKLSNIEMLMDEAKEYYNCNVARDLYEMFDTFKTNFSIVEANIKCYGEDLNKVRINFQNMEKRFKEGLIIGTNKIRKDEENV